MRIQMLALWLLASSLEAAPWTGLYLGGHAGVGLSQTNMQANQVAFSNWQGTCGQQMHLSSALMGAQAGFFYPLRDNWLLGLEGDMSGFFSPRQSTQCDCDLDADIADQFLLKLNNQGAIRGRLAYQSGAWLPYFTAGGSFANLSASYTNEVADYAAAAQIEPGWIVGGGLEWAYSPKWSLRFEAMYARYNWLNMKLPFIYQIEDNEGAANFHLSTTYIRAGVNFWLD